MRSFYFILSGLLVMALAFWAYQENYATQQVLRKVSRMQMRIGHQQEELAVLRAEWAYLNRPDRLRELADLNFSRLALLPLRPDQFGRVDQVAYPPPPGFDLVITNPVELSGRLTKAEAEE